MQTIVRESKDKKEIKLMGLCDPHFSPRTPTTFKIDYLEFLMGILYKILAFSRKENVDAIIWAGDIFHLKEPRANHVGFMTKVIQFMLKIREAGIDNLMIAGNPQIVTGKR